jgi:hypothetical protein
VSRAAAGREAEQRGSYRLGGSIAAEVTDDVMNRKTEGLVRIWDDGRLPLMTHG